MSMYCATCENLLSWSEKARGVWVEPCATCLQNAKDEAADAERRHLADKRTP